ncbi:hypothetical protein BT96DRAFT_1004877 [Gymnopus androsaceus JB14]|uniref:Uncharacterized protein n=1 Tax=Gymnopus androsaceus JB14 TaxID=1447944 RepID=A0A6A4GRA1_9AGAR|nr:hypothetical protein BT96DRAFT_1004877 [Gymnopus androsaceus JB14]
MGVGRYTSVKNAALRGHKRVGGSSSSSKRIKTNHQTHNRVLVADDFEVVHSRDGKIDAHGAPVASQRSPQKGRIKWMGGNSWNAHRDYGNDSLLELGSEVAMDDFPGALITAEATRKKRK